MYVGALGLAGYFYYNPNQFNNLMTKAVNGLGEVINKLVGK